MNSTINLFDLPEPSPTNMKLWLGSFAEFNDIYQTKSMLQYYRDLYATNFGIKYSVHQVYVNVSNDVNDLEVYGNVSFVSYVLFFNTKREMEEYERNVNRQ